MKKSKLKVNKYNFEKFEIAKLSNMKNIRGGDNIFGDPTTGTDTGRVSSKICKTILTTGDSDFRDIIGE